MMQRLKLAFIALTATASLSAPANAGQPECVGFETGGSSPLKIDQFYAARAVSIMRAALRGDSKALDALVAPKAAFSVWRGDSAFASRRSGVPGVLELVRYLKPSHFQIATDFPGPISLTSLKCEWTTAILFRADAADEGIVMKFEFADGLLAKATGRTVVILEGDVR